MADARRSARDLDAEVIRAVESGRGAAAAVARWLDAHASDPPDALQGLVSYGLLGADRRTLVHRAAASGDAALLASLLPLAHGHPLLLRGGSPKARRTPLHEAASRGNVGCVHVLVSWRVRERPPGALDATKGGGWTALMVAAAAGHADVVDVLICAGAQWRDVRNAEQASAFILAARAGALVVLERLWNAAQPQAEALLRQTTRTGRSALHSASFYGHTDSVLWLMAHGANLKLKDSSGNTFLHDLAENGHSDCISELADAIQRNNIEPLLEAQDCLGLTPVHHAAMRGHFDVTDVLLGMVNNVKGVLGTLILLCTQRVASTDTSWPMFSAIQDSRGRTAAQLAEVNGHTIMGLLADVQVV